MEQHFLDVLKRHAANLTGQADRIAADLEAACLRLADALGGVEPSVRQELLALVQPCVAALLGRREAPEAAAAPEGRNGAPAPEQTSGPQPMKLTPELLEWYRQNTNMEEMIAQLREVQETGGLELEDFLPELEKEFGLDE